MMVHIYVHAESGCGFISRDPDLAGTGDGLVDFVISVDERYAPVNQAMFEAILRAKGYRAPSEFDFNPKISD